MLLFRIFLLCVIFFCVSTSILISNRLCRKAIYTQGFKNFGKSRTEVEEEKENTSDTIGPSKFIGLSLADKKQPLAGRVCCVTGASRGIGKGIALALSSLGATVYVTSRSLNASSCTEREIGGTLADLVDVYNQQYADSVGSIVPVAVDHGRNGDEQVKSLFLRIRKERGRLDILVNNAFQLPKPKDGQNSTEQLFQYYWKLGGDFYDSLMDVGLRSHYIASHYATPLLLDTYENDISINQSIPAPMVAHISSFGGVSYSFSAAYGVGKAGVDRLAKDMQTELTKYSRGKGIANQKAVRSICIYPGIVSTERMQALLGEKGEFEVRTGMAVPSQCVETPELSGLAIAAVFLDPLATSDQVGGKVSVTAELAEKYSILDPVSKYIPPSIRSLRFLVPALFLRKLPVDGIVKRSKLQALLLNLVPDIRLPMVVMKGGSPVDSP